MGNLNAVPISSADMGGYGWKNADAVHGTTGNGAPGEISQGDLLSAIGSLATVRSDTFRIRAYGEALDTEGKVIARAWCEAVVQRTPAPVAGDSLGLNPRPGENGFGRKFTVASFRWLKREEI